MTRADHATGTDRVAEVAARLGAARIIVNLQGDEPEISGEALDRAVALLDDDPEAPMATLATPIRDEAIYRDPACVKVVCSAAAAAPCTSRAARSPAIATASPIPRRRARPIAYLHLGLYAYRRDFLLDSARFPLPARGRREARAAPRPRCRLSDRRRRRRRAEHRHRHARGLPAVRRAVAGRPKWTRGRPRRNSSRPRLRDEALEFDRARAVK